MALTAPRPTQAQSTGLFQQPRRISGGAEHASSVHWGPQSWDRKAQSLQPAPPGLGQMKRVQLPCAPVQCPQPALRSEFGVVGTLARHPRPCPKPSALEGGGPGPSPRVEEKVGAGARVPVGNPVGMRLGSHVSRARGGSCGSGGRGQRGPARGPCSAPGPPRAASSRAGALGPAEARAARQGPGRGLGERLPARRDGRSGGVRGAAAAAAGGRAGGRARAWRRERPSAPPGAARGAGFRAQRPSSAW